MLSNLEPHSCKQLVARSVRHRHLNELLSFEALFHELRAIFAHLHNGDLGTFLVVVELLWLGSLDLDVLTLNFALLRASDLIVILITVYIFFSKNLSLDRFGNLLVFLVIVAHNLFLLYPSHILEVLIMLVPYLPLLGPRHLMVILVIVPIIHPGTESLLARCQKIYKI